MTTAAEPVSESAPTITLRATRVVNGVRIELELTVPSFFAAIAADDYRNTISWLSTDRNREDAQSLPGRRR
jgi:hypothetical protein